MKNLLFIIISFFYPLQRLKDCSVADKKQREKNYKFNQENRFLLFDCALNCGYLFCWLMGVLDLLEIYLKTFYFFNLTCATLGICAAITFTMALQQILIFLFLSKEIEK